MSQAPGKQYSAVTKQELLLVEADSACPGSIFRDRFMHK